MQVLLWLGMLCFAVALLDSILKNAHSLADLTIVGKSATGLFLVFFGILFTRGFIIPVFGWLIKLFKK